jgi:hypothetical protein
MTNNWTSNIKILPNKAKNPERLLLLFESSFLRRRGHRRIIEYYNIE